MIRVYTEQFVAHEVSAVEVPFEIDLVDPDTGEVLLERFRGRFDLLGPDDTIVELETSTRRFDVADLRHDLRLTAYAYAYRQLHGRSPTIVHINLLQAERPSVDVQSTKRGPSDDARFVHMITNIVRGIDAGAFPPNPTRSCTYCEYARACSRWRDGRMLSLREPRHLSLVTEATTRP